MREKIILVSPTNFSPPSNQFVQESTSLVYTTGGIIFFVFFFSCTVYLGECEDKFPKACEDWAAHRYCLTFSELMKRYCRKACKLCSKLTFLAFSAQ